LQTIDDTTADNPDGLMVPVVIGILLAVVVLVVVIFFIVKRRKSQTKYDPESAQNGEETKQLKESNPEA
jgi:mannitol-specific phosphotransferase system IIBC component